MDGFDLILSLSLSLFDARLAVLLRLDSLWNSSRVVARTSLPIALYIYIHRERKKREFDLIPVLVLEALLLAEEEGNI